MKNKYMYLVYIVEILFMNEYFLGKVSYKDL